MKGLRATCIPSERPFRKSNLVVWFNRYQLWEHEVIPVQPTRPKMWLPGKIIHHLDTKEEVEQYLRALAFQYGFVVGLEGEI